MSQKFKKGDLVVLKSGGPSMTIHEYRWVSGFSTAGHESQEEVYCKYFDIDQKLKTELFNQDTLKLYQENEE